MAKKFDLEETLKEINEKVGVSDIEKSILRQEALCKDYFYENFDDLNKKPVNDIIGVIYKNTDVKAPEIIKRALVELRSEDKSVKIYEPEQSPMFSPGDKSANALSELLEEIKKNKENSEKIIDLLTEISKNTKENKEGTDEMLALMKGNKKDK